jgi:two-component system chemotaxis sensor kinase CheA
MSSPGAVTVELNEVANRLADLAAGNVDALHELRPVLHRIVVSPAIPGAVKTFVVQALLLLDDPRVATPADGGTPLLLKIRKLLEAALAANAADTPALGTPAQPARLEFSPDVLIASDLDRTLLDEFISESREQLATAEAALLALDTDPDDNRAVEEMFRALHTIKGTSAFIGVEHVTELAHHAESLLERVRSGSAICSGELSNLLFRSIDMLDAMIVAIETTSNGSVALLPNGYSELLATLRSDATYDIEDTSPRSSGSVRRVRAAEPMVRIRASDLDQLVGAVRELVLTHSMVSRDSTLRSGAHPDLARKIAHAEALVFELDEIANGLRNVSFSPTLQKLARIARDAAYHSGKSIELLSEGEDVLIERATAEALVDPLMHMVRNAIDHGIESAEERMVAGKPPVGLLRIAAHRVGPELVIELADDGRGLDARQLVRTAVERGLISASQVLGEQDAFALIMRPGFTTARVVTGLSGRGVGMDVARSSVDALGGTIEITSRVGRGTTFTIRLPFRTQPQRAERNAPLDTWGEPPRMIGLIA